MDEVESRCSTRIGSLVELLKNLTDFLEGADSESVENLVTEFTETFLEQSEEYVGEDRLARAVDFLSRAGRRISERRNRRVLYSFVDEYFDSSTGDVLAWLAEEAPGSSVLSLPGSSGVHIDEFGQTLSEGSQASGGVHRRYWIDVSGTYKLENLPNAPMAKLKGHWVRRNRYMFAFDDEVFHQEFWHIIKQALGYKDKGDRIIPASSFEQGSFDQVQRLGPLSDKESWQLFCRIAFQDETGGRCPEELLLLSEEIVKICCGFPLPIAGMAGLLSQREKQESEWRIVRNSFKVEVKTNLQSTGVVGNPTPGSSHYQPNSNLQFLSSVRSCFLYLGVFPRDLMISNDKLFRLWIAEGLVRENGEMTLEEVAEECLNELVRSIRVCSFQSLNRFEQCCRAAQVDDFNFRLNLYHILTLHEKSDNDTTKFDSGVRSLLYFNHYHGQYDTTEIIRRCKNLTVLDFECYPITYIPGELGTLIHLKYLSFKSTKVRKLPKSVEKLVHLQTLDVSDTLLVELPVEINMLTNLRHLSANVCDDGIIEDPTQGVRLNKGIGRLHNLQTLMIVEAQDSNVGIIKEIAALQQLRTLDVSGLTVKTVTALCASIDKLVLLKSLSLRAKNGKEDLNLGNISSELPLLQRLVLKGQFHNLPNWIFRLQYLSVLYLSLTQLTEEQLIYLSHLPNLVTLWLCRAYEGERLYFKQGSFKKLKILVLRELHRLYELEIEDGALPCLEELRIGSSSFLDEVPSGIQYLKNLKILINYDMPKEFVVRMQPNGGLDYWKVKHIHSVFFLCRVQGRKYKLFELGAPELVDHLLGLATNAYHIIEPQDEHEFTYYKDKDEDVVGPLSFFYRAKPAVLRTQTKQSSFASSAFTDDVEM